MIIPPLANQPIAHQYPPTREHHQFLLGLHSELLAAQDRITALETAGGFTATLGPFFINDVGGTATTLASAAFFNTATAVNQAARPLTMPRAGRVVGLYMVADDNRTAGTATARVNINTVGTAFDGGSVQINGTNVNRASGLVAYSSGVSFNAGNDVGPELVTSGFTPTTTNVTMWMTVKFEAF